MTNVSLGRRRAWRRPWPNVVALAGMFALTGGLLPVAAEGPPAPVRPRAGLRLATPEEVAKRIGEETTAIETEPPVAGLSRSASYYLRLHWPDLVTLAPDDATAENLRFAAAELHQPSPFTCVGDFDGDGREDVAVIVKDRTTLTLKLLALHQVTVNWNVGGLTSTTYQAYTIAEGGRVTPESKFDDLLVVCEKPGHFESVDGSVGIDLRHHSTVTAFRCTISSTAATRSCSSATDQIGW